MPRNIPGKIIAIDDPAASGKNTIAPIQRKFTRSCLLPILVFLGTLLLAACAPMHGGRGGYLNVIPVDQRPPLVGAGALADSLYGPAGESERGDGIAESRRAELEALVRRFAPTLILPDGDQATVNGRTYQLLPSDPQLFAETLQIDLICAAPYHFCDSLDILFRNLSTDSLAKLVEAAGRYESDPQVFAVWYFDFHGGNPREWWRTYGRLRTGPDSLLWAQPTVYAHPFLDFLGRAVIQYWYFYAFNDFVGNHEGDWEHVNVVLTRGRDSVAEVHYFFHARSMKLPQGAYRPRIVDQTHPVVYAGGRAYRLFDYSIQLFTGDLNAGSHGNYPYSGRWEGAIALSQTEIVSPLGEDSSRVVPHDQFRVVLTPEPSRIDFRRKPEILKEWAWLMLPVRWGFPSAPSVGAELKITDVGNRAPFGPAFNAGWNRTVHGFLYSPYAVRRIGVVRTTINDLLQPWNFLYLYRYPRYFRTARYVHDTQSALNRRELSRRGLAPRGSWAERGLGTTILGAHLGIPAGDFSNVYRVSTGFSVWRNLWVKFRLGWLEVLAGYQKFLRKQKPRGSLYIYPITGNVVLRLPDALFRPYLTLGGGWYWWQSQVSAPGDSLQYLASGRGLGTSVGVGVEYYLKTKVALDVGLRYHSSPGPGAKAGLNSSRLRFLTLWIGHYFRF